MWLVKERNGEVYLSNRKPLKNRVSGCWATDAFYISDIESIRESKDLVNWEDEEPLEVEIIIKKK